MRISNEQWQTNPKAVTLKNILGFFLISPGMHILKTLKMVLKLVKHIRLRRQEFIM